MNSLIKTDGKGKVKCREKYYITRKGKDETVT